jgi:hypothetical protein
MTKVNTLNPVFVEFIPPDPKLEPGKLYVSMNFSTTVHLCASGCGLKVVLPLNPAKWQLRFDGDAVSLSPSVGNWDYPCRSHYWIRNNKIQWAGSWDRTRIEAGRKADERDVDDYFNHDNASSERTGIRKRKASFAWSQLFGHK